METGYTLKYRYDKLKGKWSAGKYKGSKKTTLVCKRNDIPQTGSLRITDLHGNVHIEKFTLSMPKQCFSSKDIMFLNIDDTSVTLDSKVEDDGSMDRQAVNMLKD